MIWAIVAAVVLGIPMCWVLQCVADILRILMEEAEKIDEKGTP